MQHDESSETYEFQRFRKLDGSIERVGGGKRNGKPFPILPRDYDGASDEPEEKPLWEQERLYVNLNPVERRTWEKVLRGFTISLIAREEGVTRQAILDRIRGNRKNQGGMIGKNFWCLSWWVIRQRQQRTKDQL